MADFDLNLVRTFVLLYETGSVSRTAEELHLTQPTVSYSLAKLRRRFDNPLFLRVGRGLEPNATAHRLYEPMRRALGQIDEVVSMTDTFDPAAMPARFTLAMSDLGEIALLPRVVARAREVAPKASFTIRSLDVGDVERQLGRGDIDAFIATPMISGPQVARIPLFRELYVAVVATDHPRITGTTVTEAQLANEQFASVFGPSGHVTPRVMLSEHGWIDQVVVEVTRFTTLPYLLRSSDLVAIVPEYVAEQFAANHRVKMVTLPFDIAPIEIAAYARHAPSRSPAQAWLVDFLVEVLGEPVSPSQLPAARP